jgi:hypothetical protein
MAGKVRDTNVIDRGFSFIAPSRQVPCREVDLPSIVVRVLSLSG